MTLLPLQIISPMGGWAYDRPLLASPVLGSASWPVPSGGRVSIRPIHPRPHWHPPHPAATSSRLQLLAIPKSVHPQYAQDRPVIWPVPGPVRKAVASERVQVLSRPNQRKALFQGYNPYTVTLAARSASASPRLQELCLPLPRKCKGK
nr:testicular haploid expressed gene protein-like [Salvelinus alpinus]